MLNEATAKALLQWYVDAGIDETIEDVPMDRYAVLPPAAPEAEAGKASGATATVTRLPTPGNPPVSADEMAALQMASAAGNLMELRDALSAFDGCSLKGTATNLVFGDGNPKADIMLIGDAPGAEEDRQGKPFAGDSGKLLDLMMASIGLDRTGFYITNILPWRPPGNRAASEVEISACRPFVDRHIQLVAPRLLIIVGGTAAKTLLGTSENLMKLRGRWFDYAGILGDKPTPATVIFHPETLLRSPAQKRQAWQDLLLIRDKFIKSEA